VPTAAHWKYLAFATALVILEVATGSGEMFRGLLTGYAVALKLW
jgi:hypothetical protein